MRVLILGDLNLRVMVAGAALMGLCSCATAPSKNAAADHASVRKVDFRAAPAMKIFAERARQLGDEMYPKVCALLADGDSKFPRQFAISFQPQLPHGNTADSPIRQIRLNASYSNWFKNDPAAFDQVVVHEMAHVAQNYYRPILGSWLSYHHDPPFYWQEGIADYVCFKLGETNGRCPRCEFLYPHYRNGYACAGALLLYLDHTYNSNLVRQLNTLLRHGGYSDAFFAKATGKALPDLWAEFQQTAAFTSSAARMLELQQALGYTDAKPPKDIEQHFKLFVDQHADALTKDLLKSARVAGVSAGDIQTRMTMYIYFTQPGGSAEAYMIGLQKADKLPGFLQGEKGNLGGFLKPGDLNPVFPANRLFTATKRGDVSGYHYEVARPAAESEWQLQRAWRTNPDGTMAEDYRVP